MRVNVTELLEHTGNVLELRMSERVSYPEDGLSVVGPVRSSARLTNTGGSILVQGRAQMEVELLCSRCLSHFGQMVGCEIEEMFGEVPAAKKGRVGDDLEQNDYIFPIESDHTVDIGEIIRQNVLLDLPMKPLCSTDRPK